MGSTRCECGHRKDNRAQLCRRCSLERKHQHDWPRSALIKAVEDWVEQHGHPPTYHDWDNAGYGHPAARTCARTFGTWSRFIQAAGHTPGRAGMKRYWTKNQIAQAMLDHLAREGRWPTMRDWRRAHPDGLWPSEHHVRHTFGGWIKAEQHAGRNLTQARRRRAKIA